MAEEIGSSESRIDIMMRRIESENVRQNGLATAKITKTIVAVRKEEIGLVIENGKVVIIRTGIETEIRLEVAVGGGIMRVKIRKDIMMMIGEVHEGGMTSLFTAVRC
jgi:hypothetical protein